MKSDTYDNTYAPPRGFIARGLSVLSGVLRLFFWLLFLAWLYGHLWTDRTLIGQYLFWFGPIVLIAAGGFLLLAWVFRRLGRAPKKPRWFGAGAFGLACVWMVVWTWNLHRPIVNMLRSSPPKSALRIVHWNRSVFECEDYAATGRALASEGAADIVFMSVLNYPDQWAEVTRRMNKPTDGGEIHHVAFGVDKVFSRFRIMSSTYHRVPMEPGKDVPPVPPNLRSMMRRAFLIFGQRFRPPEELDDATYIVVKFDTQQELGRDLVAYFIDLPSNPLASRRAIVERMVADMKARQRDDKPAARIPPPDLLIGDGNIPIGSYSLGLFIEGGSMASETAGLGRLASWPRPMCIFQLDHAMAAPGWRVSDYRIIDPLGSEHMAQSFLLWPEGPVPR